MHSSTRSTSGFTLLELLVVMAILGILFGIIALNVKGLHNDAESANAAVASSLIQARTQAISTTTAVRATLTNETTLTYETNMSCTATSGWTTLSNIRPSFASGVVVTSTTTLSQPWRVCFTNRGELLSPAPSTLTVKDSANHVRTITVYLTGSVGS